MSRHWFHAPGASLNDPAIIVLVEADPNPSEVNWDTLEGDTATYKSTAGLSSDNQISGDNRELKTETLNFMHLKSQDIFKDFTE